MSRRVLAITGIAVTHIATPRKNAKTVASTPSGSRMPLSAKPVATPRPSGGTRPAMLTRAAVTPRLRTSAKFSSAPVTPTRSSTPELAGGVQHVHLLRLLGQQPVGEAGQHVLEHGRTEQHPRAQLPHDRGHAEALGKPAQDGGEQQQEGELEEEDPE